MYIYPAGRICPKTACRPSCLSLRLFGYCYVVRLIGCFTWSANETQADIYSRKLYQAELPRDISVCCKGRLCKVEKAGDVRAGRIHAPARARDEEEPRTIRTDCNRRNGQTYQAVTGRDRKMRVGMRLLCGSRRSVPAR